MKSKTIGILGLAFCSLGAVLSAISFTAGDGRVTSEFSGFDYHIPLMSDYGFKIGLFLLILGFLFQIVEKINEPEKFVPSNRIITIVLISIIFLILTLNFSKFLFL